jgi:hypothetical protein
MMELQIKFLGQFTLQFLTEIHTPLLQIRNPKWQNNKVPSEVKIFEGADQGMPSQGDYEGLDGKWMAGKGVLLRISKQSLDG